MKKTSEYTVKEMIRLYTIEKVGTVEIGKRLNTSYQNVCYYLHKNNIELTPSSYKLNDNYFNKINNGNKAYFLGLMYADGNVHKHRKISTIALTEKDKYLLEQFKKEIESKKPLYKREEKIIKGTNYIGKASYKLEISSKVIHTDLIKLGCLPNKSLILEFPTEEQVPTEFIWHFIRGYFDGDGCIYISRNRIAINIVGSESFCKSLSNYLRYSGITSVVKKEPRGNSWFISIMKVNHAKEFCKKIYEDSNIYLYRKYEKWCNWKVKDNSRVLRKNGKQRDSIAIYTGTMGKKH